MLITSLIAASGFNINTGQAFTQEFVNPSKVRTAYLYHFMRFTDWPAEAAPTSDNSYLICVPKESGELSFLNEITKKTVHDKPISIRQVDKSASLQDCHILYLLDLKPEELKHYIKNIDGLPVLTVGSDLKFLWLGGMIAFDIRKGQVTFSVNLRAANRVNLKISANMLEVAENVFK